MDFTFTSYQQYIRPSGPYGDFCALIEGTGAWDAANIQRLADLAQQMPQSWSTSRLNPSARVDSLESPRQPHWRIEGSYKAGRRILATPVIGSLKFPPLRIDIQLPDPAGLSSILRETLDLNASTHIRDAPRFTQLGISKYIARALEKWSSMIPDFYTYYTSLPFSSLINFEKISATPSELSIEVEKTVPAAGFLTLEQFRQAHGLKDVLLPRHLSLHKLSVLRQINEAVSLVEFPEDWKSTRLIFKCAIAFPELFYHELKMLLTLKPHRHVCERPLYIVTTEGQPGTDPIVVGFVLKYYDGGSLEAVLPSRLEEVRPTLEEKLKWSKQLTSVMSHLVSTEQTFFCDLKCENVVLSSQRVGHRDIILVDFEQIGTDNAWTPPEIITLERLLSVVQHTKDRDSRVKYAKLLQYALGSHHDNPTQYFRTITSSHILWKSLDRSEREAAQVFMLGKVLYCIWEGVGRVTSLNGESLEAGAEGNFPSFSTTPLEIRLLILQCTLGARELDTKNPFILRLDDQLVCGHSIGLNGLVDGSPAEVVEVARQFWVNELRGAEAVTFARRRHRTKESRPGDARLLPSLGRPTLDEILETLDTFGIGLAGQMQDRIG